MFDFSRTCPICSKVNTITIKTVSDLDAWRKGAYAQDAFPYLSAEDREVIISGICGSCWDKMFPDEEEEV